VKILALVAAASLTVSACGKRSDAGSGAPAPTPASVVETHLANLRQITKGGENAEAYWSFDGRSLSMQSTRDGAACDRIWRIDDVLGTPVFTPFSSGKGRTTCAFFTPGDQKILYASTHASGAECPPVPDHSKGYVWPLYSTYDIYLANRDGSSPTTLIGGAGYDAEATVCRNGAILFTSTRDGDIDLYVADAAGKNVKRLTDEPGYDGGAFFSADCTQIVWRASRPEGAALEEYKKLLAEGLVRPSKLEIYVMKADGTGKRRITELGAASFAPSFFPDGKRVIFASNHADPKGRNFDLYAIGVDGKNLERITAYDGFDGFPLFSPDGTKLAFSSNRNGTTPGETNVFIADWVP
jgi:Tol biopolymer transport system component